MSSNDGAAMKRVALAIALGIVATIGNALWVDAQTRAAAARTGGHLMQTDIAPANVMVEGAGPPIVFVHGFGASLDWWNAIAPALAVDHRVIRIDLIGHGGTAAPRDGYGTAQQAALVASVLDQLGVDRVTVIAHSMGGEVATALAERKPARIERMVLIDTPPTPDTAFTPTMQAFMMPMIGELMSHFVGDDARRQMLAFAFAPGYPVPERFVADMGQLTYVAFRDAHDASVAYRSTMSLPARLAALQPVPPLLVLVGAQDAIVSVDRAQLYAGVPGARVEVIAGAGHSPMVEAPAKTLALIRAFLLPPS
jgi:pimeloyl-ACP methyl ester carboxylesterase